MTIVREISALTYGHARRSEQTRSEQLVGALSRLVRAAALIGGAVFVTWQLNRGWVPLDEGTLAESAQRVLAGELPHRDFAELYTGGLSFMNAGVLWLTGGNLFWLRVPMLLVFLAYLPCVYLIARRFASPTIATLAALFAVAWGPPVYPSAMPSWYQLYLAVIGAYFLIRHHETGRRTWLFWAGVIGGLSLCCKITGLWYVLAVVVYLAFRAQALAVGIGATPVDQASPRWGSRIVLMAIPVAAAMVVVAILAEKLGPPELVNFLLPVVIVCALPVWRAVRGIPTGDYSGLTSFMPSAVPFVAGVALPIALLVAPYAAAGALGDLFEGVFVTPRGRLSGGYYSSPSPVALIFAAPVVVLLLLRVKSSRIRALDVVASALVVALLLVSTTVVGFASMWYMTTSLLPIVVILGALLIARNRAGVAGEESPLFLLLALTAFVALVQFPFAAPVYFCFVAPLALLAWLALFRYTPVPLSYYRIFPTTLLASIVAFGFVVNHGILYRDGLRPHKNTQTVIVDPTRAWIRVSPGDRALYSRTSALLQAHARGPYIYAGPDTPEIYALTGLRNPTRSLFDYLDPSNSARGESLFRTLQRRDVAAIVINTRPSFSAGLAPSTVDRLRADYPLHERVGAFDVRWKP